ncbi:hypothetical protein [Bifidobacterium sp. N5G01]|uniref:hypothetical protein n=1 Tax=Bifidobacterium sp. N5G01 TaxID=2013021 RepID=UPI00117A1662|nr:hypothetical protein [Bifidobacterium sp. N5G01]
MSARTSHDSTSSPRWKAFFPIVDAVYVMLALSVCVLTGCAPLLVVCFLPFPVAETYPWLCVALALSAPGIAAAFAIYRDHPVLRPSHFAGVESGVGKSSSSSGEGVPEWVAAPYVEADAGVAVFRPFFAAYAKLWKRSLALSAASGMLLFVLSYDARLLAQVSWGVYAMALACAIGVIALMALMTSLELAVEFPKAKFSALLRNGLLLAVFKLPITLGLAVVVGIYVWGVAHYPLPVLMLMTGLVGYLIWVGARSQSKELRKACAI